MDRVALHVVAPVVVRGCGRYEARLARSSSTLPRPAGHADLCELAQPDEARDTISNWQLTDGGVLAEHQSYEPT